MRGRAISHRVSAAGAVRKKTSRMLALLALSKMKGGVYTLDTTVQLCYCAGRVQAIISSSSTAGPPDRRDRLPLQEATGSSQQNVSKHLGVLAQAGLVGRERDGNFVRYEITDESVFSLCEEVCGGLRRQIDELDLLLEGGAAR